MRKAYVDWLSKTTGKSYRLPSEAEYEYAARAGSNARYAFTDDPADLCRFANGADQSAKTAGLPEDAPYMACSDGYPFTAPVGSLAANAFGLHDLIGNVWEWTADCFADDYTSARLRQRRALAGRTARRVTVRGGDWFSTALLVAAGRSRQGRVPTRIMTISASAWCGRWRTEPNRITMPDTMKIPAPRLSEPGCLLCRASGQVDRPPPPHGATLNSTRRSSASLASSLPVPTTISRDPLPVAISRPAQGALLVLQPVLDVVGAQAGQAIVDRRKAGCAGMADHFEAALLGRGPLRDLLEPGIVGRADAAVVDELGRARLEQELDRELVALQAVIDHLAEGVHRGAGAAQLVIGEIDAVEHAQLLAARRLQRALIDVERVAIAALRRRLRCRH